MYPVVVFAFPFDRFGWWKGVGIVFGGFVVFAVGAVADAFDDAVGDGLGDVAVAVFGKETVLSVLRVMGHAQASRVGYADAAWLARLGDSASLTAERRDHRMLGLFTRTVLLTCGRGASLEVASFMRRRSHGLLRRRWPSSARTSRLRHPRRGG